MSVGAVGEEDDPTIEAALHRKASKGVGAKLECAELVQQITDELERGIGVQEGTRGAVCRSPQGPSAN